MSASSDEIPLSLSLPRPLQASPVCEALQYVYITLHKLHNYIILYITYVTNIIVQYYQYCA